MQGYLDRISKLVGQVHLYRMDDNNQLVPLFERSKDWDYMKPDFVTNGAPPRRYVLMRRTDEVSSWRMVEFPGCCAFCISTGVYVNTAFRKRGVNRIANELRQWIAREFGYTALICTDVETNIPERKTLQANGWKDVLRVTNRRTQRVVNLSVKEL